MRRSWVLWAVLGSLSCNEYELGVHKAEPDPPQTTPPEPAPDIEVDPAAVFYEDLSVGADAIEVVTLRNVGDAPLSLIDVSIDDPAAPFEVVALTGDTIDTGGFAEVLVRWAPVAAGPDDAVLRITSDDPDEGVVDVPLHGEPLFGQILLSPQHHDFGEVLEPVDLVVTATNVGNADLTLDTYDYISTSATELFLLDAGPLESLPVVLAPGAVTDFVVRFAPTDSSGEEGTLFVFSDDPAVTEATASQEGYGTSCADMPLGVEFIAQTYDSAEVRVYVSNGDGTFAAPLVFGADLGELISSTLAIADVDADGDLEIMALIRPDEDSEYRLVRFDWDDCEETFVPTTVLEPATTAPTGVGDVDGDGDIDLVGRHNDSLLGYTMLNAGDGTFTEMVAFDMAPMWSNYKAELASSVADIDGDGNADAVMIEYSSGGSSPAGVWLFPGNGDGTFGTAIEVMDLPWPANAADLGDVDGDGFVDLVAGLDDDGDPGQVWWVRGTGAGLSGTAELFDVDPALESGADDCCAGRLALYDADGDGDLDALSGFFTDVWTNPRVDYFENSGGAVFLGAAPVLAVGDTTATYVAVPKPGG